MKNNWISGAVKNKGAFRKELNLDEGETIPKKKLKSAMKKGGKIAKQAVLAKILSRFK